ncbi:hypothetical protein GCM10010365_46030 [Streptomyces poonensis]|uniref:Uncharacterized protein n=1 Tax=Streptomyces poonensis TaxID=68255 RepID=A0A918UM98_9ACTN|nr:hypothetical protein GCM10010365_46030 [Streptomyces poonensis]
MSAYVLACLRLLTGFVFKGVLRVPDAPIVSRDAVGDPASCLPDAPLTHAHGERVKAFGRIRQRVGVHPPAARPHRLRRRSDGPLLISASRASHGGAAFPYPPLVLAATAAGRVERLGSRLQMTIGRISGGKP